jgi:hypothetical protein
MSTDAVGWADIGTDGVDAAKAVLVLQIMVRSLRQLASIMTDPSA